MSSVQLDPGDRPLDRVALARQDAHENLARKLSSQFGFTAEQARVAARPWVDPADIRKQLDQPMRKPFAGGTLLLLEGLAYSAAIGASPWNPRDLERQVYPIAQNGSSQDAWRPLRLRDPQGSDAGRALLVVEADSEHQVTTRLRISEATLRMNSQWSDSLRRYGVLEPVIGVICEIRHADGTPPRLAVVTDDGSTRISEAHAATGIDAAEAVYSLPDLDARAWRGRLGQMISAQDLALSDIDEDRAAAHRLAVVPMRLIVGIEPWRDRDQVSMVVAHHALMSTIHLDPPDPWPAGSQMDQIANAVLTHLRAANLIADDQWLDYLRGEIPADELGRIGLPLYPDERQAAVCAALFTDAHKEVVSTGIRSLLQKKRLSRYDRSDLATELVLRSVRRLPAGADPREERRVTALRSALQRTLNWGPWRSSHWNQSGRAPEELLDLALQELGQSDVALGPAGLELAMLASFWLVMSGTLRRDRRETDARSGGGVLQDMLSNARGIHQLYTAIVDGRRQYDSGTAVDTIRIRQVTNDQGDLMPLGGGGYRVIENDKVLRELYPDQNDNSVAPDSQAGANVALDLPPEAQLEQALVRLEAASTDVQDLVRAIGELRGEDGRSLVALGIADTRADPIAQRLDAAARRLSAWSNIYITFAEAAGPSGGLAGDIIGNRGDS